MESKFCLEDLIRQTQLAHPSANQARIFYDHFLKVLKKGLKNDGKVLFPNFGLFKIIKKNQRIGRNPKTGEEKIISARNMISFRPSKRLHEMVMVKER